jgi:cytochrome c553
VGIDGSDAIAWYPATYAESAHGDPISGVNRSEAGHDTGHCANCHDTFDDSICGVNPLMLFEVDDPDSQTDNFCFQCHKSDGAAQQVTNYTYSKNFGGGTATFTTIYDAFNVSLSYAYSGTSTFVNISTLTESGAGWTTDQYQGLILVPNVNELSYNYNIMGNTTDTITVEVPIDLTKVTTGDTFAIIYGVVSSHNLKDIQDLHTDMYGFTSDNNACVACHNPHTAQRNYEVTDSGRGGVKTAIRDVVAGYQNRPANLWGDEDYATSGLYELTSDSGGYQAPYYVGGSNYEPANDGISDGSNLPGYAYFCTRCHQYAVVYSTERDANLKAINWTGGGDKHGLKNGIDDRYGNTESPYTGARQTTNYVLSCTDCHEPHGSTNEWLLRTCVNGKDNISITQTGRWYEFCTACHSVDGLSNHQVERDCVGSTCHGHGAPSF